jgi:iron complex transport system substrate-binding protein
MLLALGLVGYGSPAKSQDKPRRVVSMNLCTDQMALLVASPGQLHSVSWLAQDPGSSVLSEQAKGLTVNHGQAEEIFLMEPDLVLTGTFTTRATVDLLRQLGIRVEEFAPETSIEDIRTNLLRMGDLLGSPARGRAVVAELDAQLARLDETRPPGKTVATYYANGFSSGAGTLVDAIVDRAGLINIADRFGLAGTVRLPLEVLVMAGPDIVADGSDRSGPPALAQENFVHPAYRALLETSRSVNVPSRYTICGGLFTADVVRLLQDAAR